MAEGGSTAESGQARVGDLSDEDMVIKYCLENKISKTAVDELLKRGFTSLEALRLVDISDLVGPKIPEGQRRLIVHIAAALKGPPNSLSSGVSATDGTARSHDAAGNTETTRSISNTAEAGPGAESAFTRTVPDTGLRQRSSNEQTDFYVESLLSQQQRLGSCVNNDGLQGTVPSQPQVSWSDPQIHLSSAAGKSAVSYYDICDFVQSPIEEEVVLGGQGDQQIIVKSGPKKPRLENLTLSQWSVANLAILYRLVNENKLQGSSLMDYLSYSTKVYQLVQRYSLVSVLLFDREYRRLQSSMKFRWGTDVQHLSNIHLLPRDKPAVQGSQAKKNLPATKPNKTGKSKPEMVICRNFNSQKGCSFTECKFRHACILPGCNKLHSALNHITEKN